MILFPIHMYFIHSTIYTAFLSLSLSLSNFFSSPLSLYCLSSLSHLYLFFSSSFSLPPTFISSFSSSSLSHPSPLHCRHPHKAHRPTFQQLHKILSDFPLSSTEIQLLGTPLESTNTDEVSSSLQSTYTTNTPYEYRP